MPTGGAIPLSPNPVKGGRKITRKANWRYIRGMKIRTPSRRMTDRGAPGKRRVKHGVGIGELEAGKLHGYATSEPKRTRHIILKKDVKRDGALKTMKRLNAIAVYMKRTAPSKSKTAKADRNWVKKTFTKR
jgi:hypothetical protein